MYRLIAILVLTLAAAVAPSASWFTTQVQSCAMARTEACGNDRGQCCCCEVEADTATACPCCVSSLPARPIRETPTPAPGNKSSNLELTLASFAAAAAIDWPGAEPVFPACIACLTPLPGPPAPCRAVLCSWQT